MNRIKEVLEEKSSHSIYFSKNNFISDLIINHAILTILINRKVKLKNIMQNES